MLFLIYLQFLKEISSTTVGILWYIYLPKLGPISSAIWTNKLVAYIFWVKVSLFITIFFTPSIFKSIFIFTKLFLLGFFIYFVSVSSIIVNYILRFAAPIAWGNTKSEYMRKFYFKHVTTFSYTTNIDLNNGSSLSKFWLIFNKLYIIYLQSGSNSKLCYLTEANKYPIV